MISTKQLSSLNKQEQELLKCFRSEFSGQYEFQESLAKGYLQLHLPNNNTGNFLELSYDNELLVLGIGNWCHDHPDTIQAAIEMIYRIIQDKIIVWKITRPDGYWYSGFYDIEEWKQNVNMVDEPDTGVTTGDKIKKSTFSKILEERVI